MALPTGVSVVTALLEWLHELNTGQIVSCPSSVNSVESGCPIEDGNQKVAEELSMIATAAAEHLPGLVEVDHKLTTNSRLFDRFWPFSIFPRQQA